MIGSSSRWLGSHVVLGCLLAVVATGWALAGCSKPAADREAPTSEEALVIRYEGSPGNVTLSELADDLGFLAPVRLEYVGNNMTGGPHSIQSVLTGDLDIGGAFNGSVIKLIAAGAPLVSVISAYGTDEKMFQGFYSLDGSPIKSARDFIGKKVAINTLGAHAEFVLREYLARGGLSTAEVAQVTMVVLPASSGEQALRSEQVDVASLSTIYRDKALARGGISLVFSDYQLFGSFNAGSAVMSRKFVEQHPAAARKYVEAIGRAIEWARATPRERVVERLSSIIEKRGRHEDTSIIQYWTTTTIPTPRGLLRDEDFQMWIEWLVRDGQLSRGQVAPADIYTNEFQPAVLGQR
ncbi:MAG TPA: ABC transporter substrate-binding protein [Polyangiaceae bacterium]|nr:ABC transporter substrate-binding protein [Polyangiaceae bacterium]